MNKIIRIAIIDDGISEDFWREYFHTSKNVLCLEIHNGNCKCQAKKKEEITHGTVCTAILLEYIKKIQVIQNVELISISIKNIYNEQNIFSFYQALRWCVNKHVDIILMSIGLKNFLYAKSLVPIIKKAYHAGIVMIAASSNDDCITYPACFENVIGVKTIRNSGFAQDYLRIIFQPEDGIEIIGGFSASNVLKYISQNYSVEFDISNSFIVPYVASFISKILLNNGKIGKKKILDLLPQFGYSIKTNKYELEKNKINIPVIGIFYKILEKNITDIMEEIIDEFKNKRYSCICLSMDEGVSNFEKGYIRIESGVNVYRKIEYYKFLFRNNSLIILLANSKKNFLISSLNFTINVYTIKPSSIIDQILNNQN